MSSQGDQHNGAAAIDSTLDGSLPVVPDDATQLAVQNHDESDSDLDEPTKRRKFWDSMAPHYNVDEPCGWIEQWITYKSSEFPYESAINFYDATLTRTLLDNVLEEGTFCSTIVVNLHRGTAKFIIPDNADVPTQLKMVIVPFAFKLDTGSMCVQVQSSTVMAPLPFSTPTVFDWSIDYWRTAPKASAPDLISPSHVWFHQYCAYDSVGYYVDPRTQAFYFECENATLRHSVISSVLEKDVVCNKIVYNVTDNTASFHVPGTSLPATRRSDDMVVTIPLRVAWQTWRAAQTIDVVKQTTQTAQCDTDNEHDDDDVVGAEDGDGASDCAQHVDDDEDSGMLLDHNDSSSGAPSPDDDNAGRRQGKKRKRRN